MCDLGFGFRQKAGFGSKLVPFNLRTSSEPQFERQFGQWRLPRSPKSVCPLRFQLGALFSPKSVYPEWHLVKALFRAMAVRHSFWLA
jgi:hypothetical protein